MSKTKMTNKNILIIILVVAIILILIGILGNGLYQKYIKDDNEIQFIYEDGIYEVKKNKKTSIFTEEYQDNVDGKIKKLKESNDYTIDNPLIIHNPYGTGSLSYYVYYKSDEDSVLSYEVNTDGYDSFERDLSNKYSKEKEFQLIGFVPGETNTLTLKEKNKNNEALEKEFEIKTPKLEEDIDKQLKITDGEDE